MSFKPSNVSSSTSTFLLSKGISCTSATMRRADATVSFTCGNESLGWMMSTSSMLKSNGKARRTRPMEISMPVFCEA